MVGEDRGDHADGGGLAVCADHMDRLEAALGMLERGHQSAHPVQPEPHSEQLEREQVTLGLWLVQRASSSLFKALPALGAGARAWSVRLAPPQAEPWRRSPRSQA